MGCAEKSTGLELLPQSLQSNIRVAKSVAKSVEPYASNLQRVCLNSDCLQLCPLMHPAKLGAGRLRNWWGAKSDTHSMPDMKYGAAMLSASQHCVQVHLNQATLKWPPSHGLLCEDGLSCLKRAGFAEQMQSFVWVDLSRLPFASLWPVMCSLARVKRLLDVINFPQFSSQVSLTASHDCVCTRFDSQ